MRTVWRTDGRDRPICVSHLHICKYAKTVKNERFYITLSNKIINLAQIATHFPSSFRELPQEASWRWFKTSSKTSSLFPSQHQYTIETKLNEVIRNLLFRRGFRTAMLPELKLENGTAYHYATVTKEIQNWFKQ